MENNDIMGYVRHYQRNIERAQDNEQKLLHCIGKLYKLPIQIEHLSETGIGKTVNALRKFDGEIAVAAKALVTKWKTMVAVADNRNQEAEPKEKSKLTYMVNDVDDNVDKNMHQIANSFHSALDTNLEEGNKNQHIKKKRERSMNKETSHHSKSERGKYEHKEKETKTKREHSRQDAKLEQERQEHRQLKTHKDVKKSKGNINDDQASTSNAHSKNEKEQHKIDKHKKNKEIQNSFLNKHEKTPSSKDNEPKKSRKRTNEIENNAAYKKKRVHSAENSKKEDYLTDGIDSSMGANFEDVLGALNIPSNSRKSKKIGSHSQHRQVATVATSTPSYSDIRSRVPTAVLLKKPELLTSKAKLEPLDPNIAIELSTISNNYKPMPLNQTVMDCVFNTNTSSSTKTPVRMFNDSEALAHGISSKTMRTKIYSGVKSGQVFQVPSLFDLCIRMLQKNIDALEYTGGVPFEVLKAVLERATPEQLYVFEEYNPYIIEDSDTLWKLHVQRKYRTQKRQEMESWREMFMRCQEDQDRKLSRLTETIKQKEKIVSAPIRKTQLAYVDSLVKPPRNIARTQDIFGTRAKPIATPASRVAALSAVIPNATRIGDVRLRVAASTSRDTTQSSNATVRSKKAPLMAKTLQLMRGRQKR